MRIAIWVREVGFVQDRKWGTFTFDLLAPIQLRLTQLASVYDCLKG
jgi:hypothetical protein